MANELQTILPPILETVAPKIDRHLSVDINNLLTGNNIEKVEVRVGANVTPPLLTPAIEDKNFNRQYYNLFVGGDLDIEHSQPFKVDIDRALTEYIADDLKNKFLKLEDENVRQEICTFPCIFANENHHYGYTDDDQTLGFGYVKQIKVRKGQGKILIYPQVMYQLPQQRLNEALLELDLYGSNSFNEFNRMHWCIKEVDLISELVDMGFSL